MHSERALNGLGGLRVWQLLAVAAPSRKPLVPLTLRDVWLDIEPRREAFELRRPNLPALKAIEQMLEEGRRDVLTADLRH